jgi:hypothetical protein
MRKSKKLIAILATLALLVTMLVPMVGPAAAAGSISALSVPSVTDDPTNAQALGTVKVTVPAGSIENGDSITIKLPSGYDFFPPGRFTLAPGSGAFDETTDPGAGNRVMVPTTINAAGDANGMLAANVRVGILNAKDEIQITALANQSVVGDFVFYVYFGAIEVEEGTDDDCKVTFDGPSGTGFPLGTVVIGKSISAGKVILSLSGADTSNDNFNFDLRIKEETAGSLQLGNETLKVKLPSGYVWAIPVLPANAYVAPLWGEGIFVNIATNVKGDELIVDFNGADANGDGICQAAEVAAATARDTNIASAWDINGVFAFTVDDESKCKPGDIIAKISGETDTNASEAPVGTYGEFGATVSAKSTPEIIAGQDEQEIGDIVIKESIGRTLVVGRTVTLALPSGARWQPVYVADIAAVAPANLPNFDRDEGLVLNFTSYTGTDDRMAKFTVGTSSGDAAEIDLEDIEVAVEAGFEGDLVVTVGGSAGLSGEVVVAKVKSPISASSSSKPNVIIGAAGQVAGDFTITENIREGFIDGGTVNLDLPPDVEFDGTPTVKVTNGDLSIGNVRRANANNQVRFDIEGESTTPSTIEVSNIKLRIYRTVPEGNIELKVQGAGIVETVAHPDWTNSDTAAKAIIATCVTPPPGEQKATVVFKINDTNFTVNGMAQTMDVAPYIKDGRTFLPVRYVAQACGVSADNILYSDGKVTLIKGDKVVQLTLGSKVMIINGVVINMDVAAELSSDRTMLPFRWIAQALGAKVSYDEATQTVTMEI